MLVLDRFWLPLLMTLRHSLLAIAEATPLNGQHLRVLVMDYPVMMLTTRNATKHILELGGLGSLMIDWFVRKYNFSYELLPVYAPLQDDSPQFGPGSISYANRGLADFLLGFCTMTVQRYQKIDYTTPLFTAATKLLIPFPDSKTNYFASFQPFLSEIWIGIAVSIAVVSLILFWISKPIGNPGRVESGRLRHIVDYIIQVLTSQGGYIPSNNNLKMRLTTGAWCLACFVLVQSYQSTLISFIMNPVRVPIVNSPHDIPKVAGLKLTVERGFPVDVNLMAATSGIYKQLGDMLRADPSLRCNVTEDCLKKVRSGNHVFARLGSSINSILINDWKASSGSCSFLVVKELFDYKIEFVGLACPKGSPYCSTITQGVMEMQASGLMGKWLDQYQPTKNPCTKIFLDKTPNKTRITLRNLSSAFLILAFGLCLSFIVFIGERIVFAATGNRR